MCVSTPSQGFGGLETKRELYNQKGKKLQIWTKKFRGTKTVELHVGVRVCVVGLEILSLGMRRNVPWCRNSTKFMTAMATMTTTMMMMI